MVKITALIFLSLIALTGCDSVTHDTYEKNLTRAKAAFDKKDYNSSIIEIRSALQKNPESWEARELLGRAKAEVGNWPDAETEIRLAIERGAPTETAAKYLYQSLLMQNKLNELVNDPIGIPVNTAPKDKALIYAYRGQAWLGLGNIDNAKKELQIGLLSDPNAPLIQLGLAEIALNGNDIELAINILKESLQKNPQEANLWDLLGEAQRHLNQLSEAENSFSQAIEYSHGNITSHASRALTRIDLGKLGEAHQDLDILTRKAPNHYVTHYVSSVLYYREKKYLDAKSELEQTLHLNENYSKAYYLLGLTYIELNDFIKAEEAISKFRSAYPDSPQAVKALAYSKFRNHDYKNARLLIQVLYRQNPKDDFTLNLLGNIELSDGNNEKALEYFQKLAELDPKSTAPKLLLSRAYFFANQFSKGIEELETIKQINPSDTSQQIALVTAEIRANHLKKARELVQPLFSSLAKTPIPYNLLGLINIKEGKYSEAISIFQEGLAKHEADPTLTHNLAHLLIRDKRLAEAKAICETTLQVHPKHLGISLDLAFIESLQGNQKASEIKLNELIAEYPEAIEPKGILARQYIQAGEAHRALTLLESALEDAPDNPLLLENAAQAQLDAKLFSKAADSAKKLTQITPHAKEAHFLLAKSYESLGDAAKMTQALDQALQIDPKYLAARALKVRYLILTNKTEEADKMLASLEKDAPNNLTILDLKGWAALRANQPKLAIAAYQSLLEKSPNPETLTNLVNAELAANELNAALQRLEQWLKQHPKDGRIYYFRSGILASLGQFDAARKDMEKALSINPDNVLVLNDLAWLIRNSDKQTALRYAEKAASLAPYDTNIKDTLAMVYLESGDTERAIRNLQSLSEAFPEDPSVTFHLALAREKAGEKQAAVELLRKAVASTLNFPERTAARDRLSALSN